MVFTVFSNGLHLSHRRSALSIRRPFFHFFSSEFLLNVVDRGKNKCIRFHPHEYKVVLVVCHFTCIHNHFHFCRFGFTILLLTIFMKHASLLSLFPVLEYFSFSCVYRMCVENSEMLNFMLFLPGYPFSF